MQLMMVGGIEVEEERSSRIERLYFTHRDRVFRLALRYGAGDRAFAEDVTQDVFIKLMKNIDRLDREEALWAWLYKVTANRCLSKLSRAQFRRSLLTTLGLFKPSYTQPQDAVEARSELARTMSVLASLSPKARVAFTMLHLDGKSQNEIAQIMGHSKGYVSKLIQKANVHIRAAGFEVPDA